MLSMITNEDFEKIELRIGTVIEAVAVLGSNRLIKQIVDFGELGQRQIVSGIRQWYKPESLIGKQFVYCVNLEPKKMMSLESQGMILATDAAKPILLKPAKEVPPGAKLR
jgi:methionine--tRNA ligase beta chain